MIDLCEDCGARLEMDEDGQFFCPIERADVAAWRAEFGRQVRRYPAQAGQGLPTIRRMTTTNAERARVAFERGEAAAGPEDGGRASRGMPWRTVSDPHPLIPQKRDFFILGRISRVNRPSSLHDAARRRHAMES
jgi:hypothetical protein